MNEIIRIKNVVTAGV